MSAGFTSVSSSLFLTGLFGLVKLVSATAFMFVFVRIRGNRFWLKLGTAICGITMVILGKFHSLKTDCDMHANFNFSLLRSRNDNFIRFGKE